MEEMVLVGGRKNYHKYAEKEKGDVLVDKHEYIGSKPNKFNTDKNDWEFRDQDSGEITVLNSAGQLNWLMEEYVVEGDVVTVVYDGKKTIEKGVMAGKEAHTFKLSKSKSAPVKKVETAQQELTLDDLE